MSSMYKEKCTLNPSSQSFKCRSIAKPKNVYTPTRLYYLKIFFPYIKKKDF